MIKQLIKRIAAKKRQTYRETQQHPIQEEFVRFNFNK
jgi:hypothetical protein